MRSFADYDRDLAAFMKEIVLPDCQPPYIAMAHSMGGHILLRNAILPQLVVLAHGAFGTDDRDRRGAAGQGRAFFARLRGDARRLGVWRALCRGREQRADRNGRVRRQSPHDRSRTLSAQPRRPRGGARARARLADHWLAESGTPLHRQAHRTRLSVEGPGAAAAVCGGHGYDRLDDRNRGVRAATEGRHARASARKPVTRSFRKRRRCEKISGRRSTPTWASTSPSASR